MPQARKAPPIEARVRGERARNFLCGEEGGLVGCVDVGEKRGVVERGERTEGLTFLLCVRGVR